MSGLDGMTIWIPDYHSGTQHFTTTQHGAFFLLLMAMWKSGGWLPNDETRLARIAKLSLAKWRAIAAGIMELLLVEGDRITSARLLRELDKTTVRIEARRLAGKERHRPKENGFQHGGVPESKNDARRDSGINTKSLKDNESGLANADGVLQQNASITPGTLDSDLVLEKKDSCRVAAATPTIVKDDPFDPFMAVYPKRKGDNPKKPARQKFEAALKRGVDPEEIITGAKRFAEQMAEENKIGTVYVPHAETWLNQERWKRDDAPAVPLDQQYWVHHHETRSRFDAWYFHYLLGGDAVAILGMNNAALSCRRCQVPDEWPPNYDPNARTFPLRYVRDGATPQQNAWYAFFGERRATFMQEEFWRREINLPRELPPGYQPDQRAAPDVVAAVLIAA